MIGGGYFIFLLVAARVPARAAPNAER